MGISLLHRKEYLVLTTIDIIEELGIQGLTTREIAKRQNVSEATIFRHYKNKNELLLAVLDYYIQFDTDIFQSIRMTNLTPMDAIRYYVMEYAEYYQNYPAITAITQIYDVLRYAPELEQKIKEIQQNRTKMLQELIDVAKGAEDIPEEYDSRMIAVMILGFIREICLNWRLEQYNFSFRERTRASLDLFLKAFQKIKSND
jgi:AcrR family transcriptional regulator